MTANLDSSQIAEWASRQLADYDARNPGTIFAKGLVLSAEQGYQLQSAVAELREQRGERIIGYKVGCTSPGIRAQLGINHCVTGRLFDTERHPSRRVLHRSDFASLAIEGELAVELAREPAASDFSPEGLPDCVARVMPVIELHNHVLRSARPSAGELIAHNGIHAGFVEGGGARPGDAGGESSLRIFAGDQLIEECSGSALIETVRSSLQWLMEVVRSRGDALSAGQIILTGSIPPLIPVTQGCRIRVDAPPFGDVEVQVE